MTQPSSQELIKEESVTSTFVITERQKQLHRYFYIFLFVCGLGIIIFLLYINGQSIYERGI